MLVRASAVEKGIRPLWVDKTHSPFGRAEHSRPLLAQSVFAAQRRPAKHRRTCPRLCEAGARPKASVIDQHCHWSIAKLPKETDEYSIEA